ncbi:hypothetical protein [Actinoplanes sp. NBRC 101535]|uniref:hypothetical protein n=1 Tax=Actinoplanes sp. NBRC 101535 TaxID=3032196 RepID=UPI0024A15454|nr:hypothetical protein [Actinoplanes sp. NBRC 101535]GLY07867.1 hypothetical protein Acsp01_82460 [Actinoplanes sp. NBRC 101535]
MYTGRIVTGAMAAAAMSAALLTGQPAAAAPPGSATALADRSCTVTTTWTCFTTALWVPAGANPHAATLNIPWTAPREPYPGDETPVNSFVILRNTSTGAEVRPPDNRYYGNEHDIWGSDWPAAYYRAELHCPYGCQGAQLYFDN